LLQELDETLGDATGGKKSSPSHEGGAILFTAQHVMDEVLKDRMRAETRRVLVKQLAEAETNEMKDNNKVCVFVCIYLHIHVVCLCDVLKILFQLVRRCFNTWLDIVHDARMAQDKAHTTWMWRTKCHVFQAWRGLVEQHRRQQELTNLTLQLQWEKRYESITTVNYKYELLQNDTISMHVLGTIKFDNLIGFSVFVCV